MFLPVKEVRIAHCISLIIRVPAKAVLPTQFHPQLNTPRRLTVGKKCPKCPPGAAEFDLTARAKSMIRETHRFPFHYRTRRLTRRSFDFQATIRRISETETPY